MIFGASTSQERFLTTKMIILEAYTVSNAVSHDHCKSFWCKMVILAKPYNGSKFRILISERNNKAFIASRNLKIVISAENFEKSLVHLAVQTLTVFLNLRQTKNCQCFADDCICFHTCFQACSCAFGSVRVLA